VRQGPVDGRADPQAVEQALAVGFRGVLVGVAGVIDDVVVEDLHLAGLEVVGGVQLPADVGEHVERLPLRLRHFRHVGVELGRLDVGARVVAGELAVPHPEDRQRIRQALAAHLLAEP
jgi:hypothetical protein